ncbi:MAG: hypothetical protein IH623_21620 [Verrucomicrobia bacterium]|nr:hypothetical protein [Verrucomicrobiota bacterium]
MSTFVSFWLAGLVAFEIAIVLTALACIRQGLRPVSLFAGWASYSAARRRRHKPRLLVWYERLELAGLSFIILGGLALVALWMIS